MRQIFHFSRFIHGLNQERFLLDLYRLKDCLKIMNIKSFNKASSLQAWKINAYNFSKEMHTEECKL